MKIDFSHERFEKVKRDFAKWWNNTIDRPMVWASVNDKIPDRLAPKIPYFCQQVFADLSIAPKQIADRVVFDLESATWLGDAYPYVNFDASGPGIIIAFLGSNLTANDGLIWFEPLAEKDISNLDLNFNTDNKWFIRIMDIYKEVLNQTEGRVVLGVPDLGGTLDILASLRGAENLLIDLYDSPEDVIRLCRKINDIWIMYHDYIAEFLRGKTPAFSDWSKVLSEYPAYILQSDFSYMISPEMFSEFALNDLINVIKHLKNSIYHLDGIGELKHLDKLCEISELNAIQWVPGDGQPPQEDWPDVYKKILGANKSVLISGNSKTLKKIAQDFNGAAGFCISWNPDEEYKDADSLKRLFADYGIE